ncbi:acyltransferase domain-containing protein, partial [Nocardia sp. CC201C]|uniref:acyltransferase domain-containing protein n=1 Tax=Nocardia sp. CC201C TaxID=3044575 RepID=UPI0024A89797
LALHQKVLPGTINVEAPNAEIDAATAPYYVNSRTRPWIRDPRRPVRRAAASAMGFGGTNFHLVLEEADATRGPVLHRVPRAHLWHAPDVATLIDAVRDRAGGDGGDIPEGHARIGFVSIDDDSTDHLRALAVDELVRNPDAAHWDHPEGVYFRAAALPDRKVGALFAGQGSQYVDMGADAALNNPPVGAAFDAANAGFADAPVRLGAVVFPPPAFDESTREEQENTLRRTEFAQPAIGALSAGQYRVLSEYGFRADGYLGHSFGELTALWAAGAVTTEQFFGLARARGAAMTVADGVDAGTMVAIAAARDVVEALIDGIDDVWICNHNAPDQVVVGGGTDGVATVTERCAENGWALRHLPVSGAFHTPYVGHAVATFGAAVAEVEIGAPDAPVYANTRGAAYGEDDDGNRATLTAQLSNPVEFADALAAMRADGCTVFVEFGPKQVLTSLVRRTYGDQVIAIATDSGPIGNGDLALKRAAVRLAVLGFDIRGINRFAVAEPPAVTSKPAMAVTLSAPEYVPESRRAAYAAALSDGYRATVDAPAPPPPPPAPAPVPVPAPSPAIIPSNGQSENHVSADPQYREPASALDSALAQHLHTHRHYLDGQLDLARGLAGALRDGALDDLTVRAIEAVKEHGVAISDSHSRASEVLAQLAELEGGGSVSPRATAFTVDADPLRSFAPGHTARVVEDTAQRSLVSGNGAIVPPPADTASRSTGNGADSSHRADAESASPGIESVPGAAAADSVVSSDTLRQALRDVVAEKTGYPVDMVDPAMDLEADLGVDSIKRVQVIGALQERFPALPSLGPEQLGTLRTLDQIAELLAGSAEAQPDTAKEQPDTAEASGDGPSVSEAASDDALRRTLLEVVAEKTGYPVEMIDPAMDLEADLGVDSIKRVQVIGALQERFPALPSLGPEQLGTLRTLDQILAELVGGDVHPKAEAAARTPRHLVELVELAPVDLVVDPYRTAGRAVVVCLDHSAETDCEAVEEELRERGWQVRRADGAADLGGAPADVCVVVAGVASEWEQAQRVLSDGILVAGRALPVLGGASGRAGFVTVTRIDGQLGFQGAAPVAALLGGLGGMVKTLAAEQPSLFCRALDIDPAVLPGQLAEIVLEELCDAARDTVEVGVDAAGRRRTLVPSRHAAARDSDIVHADTDFEVDDLTEDDVLLVTGGARGVTATCVRALARVCPARFVLLGRTEPVPDPEWAHGVADAELEAAAVRALAGNGVTPREIDRHCAGVRAVREIRSVLDELGERADYVAVDATDAEALRWALLPWRDAITGVVHGAGVLADSLLPDKTPESIDRVLRPKLAGLAAVLAVVEAPRHLVLFTSVAGLFGNAGQADYAAANEALSRFAVGWGRRYPERRVTALDWGAWDGGMVTAALREHFRSRGIPLLDPAAGAAAFTAQFSTARRAESVLLVGAATPLSTGAVETGPLRARRGLAGLVDEPVIAAHRIGEHIVLPATFGLGAMVNLAERAGAGRTVMGVHDFQVLKGLVFDHPVTALELEIEPIGSIDGHDAVRATVFGETTAHFRATLLYGAASEPTARPRIPDGVATDAQRIYRDAVQFHAPALQGLRRIRSESDAAIVFECSLPAEPVALGAYAGRLHNPVTADLVLQGPPVLGHRLLGTACLPLGIGRIDYHAPLPTGEPFLLLVDNPRPARMEARIDATALSADGTVLQRFSDVTVVTTPDLTEKFRTSVRRWTA